MTKNIFFQMLQLFTFICLWNLVHCTQMNDDNALELSLCQLVKHTPNYVIYHLEERSNCLSQVKKFENTFCLRDKENQVKYLHTLIN